MMRSFRASLANVAFQTIRCDRKPAPLTRESYLQSRHPCYPPRVNEKRWARSHSNARWDFRALVVATLLLFLVAGCAKPPTEVVVTVFSDLPCESSSVAAVAVGTPGELGDRILSGTSTTCSPDGSRGDVVVVPKGDQSAEFAIEVRISADPSVDIGDCVAAKGYQNCIVARRILSFLPERTVRLRVDLRNPCVSTACNQATTCVAQGTTKSCHEAQIDVKQCAPECDETTVITQHPDPVELPNPNQPMQPSDPCKPNPCDGHGTCRAVAGQATCSCEAGYAHAATDTLACTDVDECAEGGANDCDPHATCSNTPGGFSCACNEGYAGTDGTSCEQVECDMQCGEFGACVKDSTNQFACRCNNGYTGDGISCTDIDECRAKVPPCSRNAQCANTPGSFTCQCLAGYEGNGTSCTDVDECANHAANCSVGKQCLNTTGSFVCADCGAGYTSDGTTCSDIDECADHTANCDPLATCVNVTGSFDCRCPMGYTNVAGVCTDVDECKVGTPCAADHTCINTIGSFDCRCNTLSNLVPAMTSDKTPSGTVTSSGDFSDGNYPAYRAFDAGGTSAGGGMWISQQNKAPALLSYDFGSGTRTLLAYEIFFTNGTLTQRGPSAWTFEGSNDVTDTGWQKLDQRSGIKWNVSVTQRFSIATPGAYRKYRLNITDDNLDTLPIEVISIGELRLLGCGL